MKTLKTILLLLLLGISAYVACNLVINNVVKWSAIALYWTVLMVKNCVDCVEWRFENDRK